MSTKKPMKIFVYQTGTSCRVVVGRHEVMPKHSRTTPRIYTDADVAFRAEKNSNVRAGIMAVTRRAIYNV